MECINPFLVKYQTDEEQPVPCGKCLPCLKRRTSHWSFRLNEEARHHQESYFVTLTYAKLQKHDNPKLSTISPNGFPTLCKRDLQLYFKRLRKLQQPGSHIKYYAVGEYGGRTFRPHYHCIIFGAERSTITAAWSVKGRELGHVDIGTVTVKSVGYTLQYITEGQWRPKHKRDDRAPQFACMSKGLGIGYVLDESWIKWHFADIDNRMYCNLEEGKKIGMPRYYKNKLYDEETRKRIGEISREKAVRAQQDLLRSKGPDRYYSDRTAAIQDWIRRGKKSGKTKL